MGDRSMGGRWYGGLWELLHEGLDSICESLPLLLWDLRHARQNPLAQGGVLIGLGCKGSIKLEHMETTTNLHE